MRIKLFIIDRLLNKMQWVSSVTADAARSGQLAHRLIPVLGRRLVFALLTALALSTSGCAWFDAKQRNILYRPTPGEPADFAGLRAGDERYFLNVPSSAAAAKAPMHNAQPSEDTAAQQIEMWWLPHTNPTAPTLLYYHGTFRNLVRNLPKINALREAGFAVLAVDYRGWGRSTVIVPSELTIMQDAQIAFEELKRREPRASHRVLYGHSMGSGVAVEMASRLRTPSDYSDYSGLILESAMTNFPDVAVQASWLGYLVRILSNERFASIDKIANIKAPLLMIHGTRDATIPYVLGQKLFDAASQPKLFLTIEGGNHSNLQDVGKEDYQKALAEFRRQVVLDK